MLQSRIYLPKLHPKQQEAFNTLANEILYGGATRGGKSHFSRILTTAICGFVPNVQADIFRLNYEDVIKNHMEGQHSFPDLLGPWERDGIVKINQRHIHFYNTGSNIYLEHCHDDKAMLKHQGNARHIRIFEEAAQILERRIRWLRAWTSPGTEEFRRAAQEPLKLLFPFMTDEQRWNFFPKVIHTSNPIGASAGYFRRMFVVDLGRMKIGTAPEDDGGYTRIYIPARVEDNPSEEAEAVRKRVKGIGDDEAADALLNENWDANVGDFIRQWDARKHVVPTFEPPDWWQKFRTFDWGSSAPFAVYWWAVSDGEEFKALTRISDGKGGHKYAMRKHWYPAGALIAYREWYGAVDGEPHLGLEMQNEEIAKGIVKRTSEVTTNITITDSLPFQKRGGELMADTFLKNGCPLTKGNTDRVLGWKQLKDMLAGRDGWPLMYFCDCCVFAQDYIPALQRHKTKREDAVEDGEGTDVCDAIRLAAMTRPKVKKQPKSQVPDLRGLPKMGLSPHGILKQIKRKQRQAGRR